MNDDVETPHEDYIAGPNDDDIDGCACDFADEDATLDEELPVANGGVE